MCVCVSSHIQRLYYYLSDKPKYKVTYTDGSVPETIQTEVLSSTVSAHYICRLETAVVVKMNFYL